MLEVFGGTRMTVSKYLGEAQTIASFLKDPDISNDLKEVCFRLLENPYIGKLTRRTPISALFEICEEYKKYSDLYDEVFCGKIKYYLKGLMDDAMPIFNHNRIGDSCTLEAYIGPHTLNGQVVEKFAACESLKEDIRRIMIQINGNRMLTTIFNKNNKVVSMIVDSVTQQSGNVFLNFLNAIASRRVDLIRG